MSNVEIAAELGVSEATLYNWRKKYNGMDTKGYDRSGTALERRKRNTWVGSSLNRYCGSTLNMQVAEGKF
ncbi:transposase [Corynebacterium choanae]|uniref:transposase n=1 Tax=Corynebacterium choanae TaxID=1862358 RepID=UPI000F4EC674|nr:transposase [Corynebacterium choanae]